MEDKIIIQLKNALENSKMLYEQGYRYLARSASGELRAFRKKPVKEINFWYVKGEVPHPIDPYIFEDVDWNDEKPLNLRTEIKILEKYFEEKEKDADA